MPASLSAGHRLADAGPWNMFCFCVPFRPPVCLFLCKSIFRFAEFFCSFVKAKAASCSSPPETQQSAIHFFCLLVCAVQESLPTLFSCLCVQPCCFVSTAVRVCRRLCRGRGSPGDLQHPGCYQRVDRDRYVLLTDTFTKITHAGSVMRFPIHKDYYGEPAHHIGVST